ncbi:MAG TPA: helix-turn-helix domain-containing protein [Candidatus Saccharimonadales bacterium]|nr:helix-turn-helix domain-containing protein [Candidatus Saccharimonadales bacterium]
MVRLGHRLHQLRLQRRLTLEEIAQEIRIKSTFLAAIEKGEYNKLPSPAYAQGFVINYATYLGLSKTETTMLFKREFDEKRAMKVLPDVMVKTKEFPLARMRVQQSVLLFAFFLIIILAYLFFQYRAAFLPPSVSITAPLEGSKTSQDVLVTGKADSNATVTVNGDPATVGNDGTFQKEVTLFPGNATITVKATNRFGKTSVVEETVNAQ